MDGGKGFWKGEEVVEEEEDESDLIFKVLPTRYCFCSKKNPQHELILIVAIV